jgi:hypothetical protein
MLLGESGPSLPLLMTTFIFYHPSNVYILCPCHFYRLIPSSSYGTRTSNMILNWRLLSRCLFPCLVAFLCTTPVVPFCAPVATTARRSASSNSVLLHGGATLEKKPSKTQLPPVLEYIANERAEFHLNLGRAMDVLRRDMPDILKRKPGMHLQNRKTNL